MAKWVYMFTEGNADMRNLLGGKGANLAEMTNLGLPVPQGFTVTTEACTQYLSLIHISVEVVEQLSQKEKPDSVLPTLGGQAGLNLAMELEEKGFLKENNVRLIGTTAQTIKKAEDRQEFKDTMEKIGEPVADVYKRQLLRD